MTKGNIPVLDLDSTLVLCVFRNSLKTDEEKDLYDNIEKHEDYDKVKDRIIKVVVPDISDNKPKGQGKMSEFMIIKRPYLNEFVDYLKQEKIETAVWSAGLDRYVRVLVHFLFEPDEDFDIDIIYSRVHCKFEGDNYVIKSLKERGFDTTKTIIIDDREEICKDNHLNSINISPYEPKFTMKSIMRTDTALKKIVDWMKEVDFKNAENVEDLNKEINF